MKTRIHHVLEITQKCFNQVEWLQSEIIRERRLSENIRAELYNEYALKTHHEAQKYVVQIQKMTDKLVELERENSLLKAGMTEKITLLEAENTLLKAQLKQLNAHRGEVTCE